MSPCIPVRAGKLHWRNTKEQLELVGPRSLGVALLTAGFVGMVFTIQVGAGLGFWIRAQFALCVDMELKYRVPTAQSRVEKVRQPDTMPRRLKLWNCWYNNII